MPAYAHPSDIAAVVISRSSTHVVLGVEISRVLLHRHAALLRELARIAEDDPRDRLEEGT